MFDLISFCVMFFFRFFFFSIFSEPCAFAFAQHDQVKARLATVNKETQRLFKERYRMVRDAKKDPISPRLGQHASMPVLPNATTTSTSSTATSSNSNSNVVIVVAMEQAFAAARAKAVVLKAWAPSEGGSRLMLKENDVVEILSFESSEWCRVQLGRIKGAVPTSNLRALPASGRILGRPLRFR
jgi:hypothetical protein